LISVKVHGLNDFAYAGEALTKGRFVYFAGFFAAGDAAKATPGYSSNGDRKVLVANGFTLHGIPSIMFTAGAPTLSGGMAAPKDVYPCNKLEYTIEDSDYELDAIASGESCLFYRSGQYQTDQWSQGDATTTDMTAAEFGALLYLDNLGRLTRSTGYTISGFVVARFINLTAEPSATGAGVAYPNWQYSFYTLVNHAQTGTASNSARLLWFDLISAA
jgi:hypothetical protein